MCEATPGRRRTSPGRYPRSPARPATLRLSPHLLLPVLLSGLLLKTALVVAGLCLGALGLYFEVRGAEAEEPPALPPPVVLSAAPPADHHVVTLAVDGMHCDGCASHVYRALRAHPAVHDAAVDVEAGRAQAVVPLTVDVETIAEGVVLEGFQLRPLE